MELTTLKEVWISDSPAFDLSLLGRLINLEGVRAWDVPIKDLSPLAGLTKLRWLDFGRIPISDLASVSEPNKPEKTDILRLRHRRYLVSGRIERVENSYNSSQRDLRSLAVSGVNSFRNFTYRQ